VLTAGGERAPRRRVLDRPGTPRLRGDVPRNRARRLRRDALSCRTLPADAGRAVAGDAQGNRSARNNPVCRPTSDLSDELLTILIAQDGEAFWSGDGRGQQVARLTAATTAPPGAAGVLAMAGPEPAAADMSRPGPGYPQNCARPPPYAG